MRMALLMRQRPPSFGRNGVAEHDSTKWEHSTCCAGRRTDGISQPVSSPANVYLPKQLRKGASMYSGTAGLRRFSARLGPVRCSLAIVDGKGRGTQGGIRPVYRRETARSRTDA